MLSIFKRYILPKEIDFFDALKKQSDAIDSIINDLQRCFLEIDKDFCRRILNDESNSKEIKKENIKNLLGTFITPIDRESIYRVITELDWIAISVRHFILEVKAFKVENLKEYNLIFQSLVDMSKLLNQAFLDLKDKKTIQINTKCEEIREVYDKIVSDYIIYIAQLAKRDNIKNIFVHKEILFQLKDVAKRFHLCANSLDDIVAKSI